MKIIIATVIIAFVIAFVLGMLLGFFKKVFAVHEDEKVTKIKELLPNGNCGGCGYAGCSAYAEAVASGKAPLNACTAGGAEVAKAIAEIMGGTAEVKSYIAVLACQGSKTCAVSRGNYTGVETCAAAAIAVNGTKMCASGCIGFGDCVKVCKFGAMTMGDDGLPKIDKAKCTGCGACARACPHKLLKKIDTERKAPLVLCSCVSDKKPDVVKNCSMSCIKCQRCVRECPEQAITMEGGVPFINEEKCTACGTCVTACLRKVIKFLEK